MKISGATTPSEVFSATVSTAALATPSSSSGSVSRPTIQDRYFRARGKSPALRGVYTRILSVRSDFIARIW